MIWVFPKIMVPQNGWFIRGNPLKMDDLGVPLFLETPMCNLYDNDTQYDRNKISDGFLV